MNFLDVSENVPVFRVKPAKTTFFIPCEFSQISGVPCSVNPACSVVDPGIHKCWKASLFPSILLKIYQNFGQNLCEFHITSIIPSKNSSEFFFKFFFKISSELSEFYSEFSEILFLVFFFGNFPCQHFKRKSFWVWQFFIRDFFEI